MPGMVLHGLRPARRVRPMRAGVALLGWHVAACGAAPLPESAYVAAVTEAAAAERADRHAEAAAAYERAAGLTQDAVVARTALYRAAQAAERAGLRDRALAALLDIADRFPGAPEAGRALHDAARILRRAGDDDGAEALLVRLIRAEPRSSATSVGIRRLARIYGDRGDDEGLDVVLSREIAATTDRETRVVLLYHRALCRHGSGRIDDALADLDAAATDCPYPECSYWDDIPWQAATICRGAGRFDRALLYLDALLALREEAWLNGSYYSIFHDDAQRAKAEILRDEMGKPEEAARAFLELEEFRDSVMRDDGLFAAAAIYLDVMGDPDRGCGALRDLLERYPDSNLRRRASERLGAAPCSDGG